MQTVYVLMSGNVDFDDESLVDIYASYEKDLQVANDIAKEVNQEEMDAEGAGLNLEQKQDSNSTVVVLKHPSSGNETFWWRIQEYSVKQ